MCITKGEDTKLVTGYCESIDLYCDIVDASEFDDLKTALAKNRALANYDYILFYFPQSAPSDLPAGELLEAVSYIRKFFHARIILFAPEHPAAAPLLGKLSDMGLREVVPVSEDTDLGMELAECLSIEGKSFADSIHLQSVARMEEARTYIRPLFTIPDDLRLRIAIAGSERRTGVTTAAFSFYHGLAALGFTPCIVDTKQTFIESLMNLYEEETSVAGSIVTIMGMDFAPDVQVGSGHNVFLYDLGILDNENRDEFRDCDLRILCAGAKAWELPEFGLKFELYGSDIDQILFSFASEREQQAMLSEEWPCDVSFAPWNPDIWAHTNKEWHEQQLIPFLKRRIPS